MLTLCLCWIFPNRCLPFLPANDCTHLYFQESYVRVPGDLFSFKNDISEFYYFLYIKEYKFICYRIAWCQCAV